MAVPKTIIITSLSGRSTPSDNYTTRSGLSLLNTRPKVSHMEVDSRKNGFSTLDYRKLSTECRTETSKPPRKRQRLDHLSIEEKIMRRKVKNRVAAQSARDRKKAQMTELEYVVKELSDEKDKVMAEVEDLKLKNYQLEQENLELKRRLGLIEQEQSMKTDDVKKVISNNNSIEHASLISGPLQKDQDLQLLTPLMMQLVYFQMILSLMTFLSFYKNVVKNFSSVTLTPFPIQMNPLKKEFVEMMVPTVKWWGAHQKSWNPSKN